MNERFVRPLCAAAIAVFFTSIIAFATGISSKATSTRTVSKTKAEEVNHPDSRRARLRNDKGAAACTPCGAQAITAKGRRGKKSAATASIPCHPADYVDPRVRKDLKAAMVDLKRAGITPKITSAWRSSNEQEAMYKCSYNKRCRGVHPGLYKALPPGQSAHEAGLALDISGVASGPRGGKRITPQGRRIVQIMGKHGFKWRYGLRDPVHFEADPASHGYRNLQQAIHVTQTTCEAKILARQMQPKRSRRSKNGTEPTANVLKRRTALTYTQASSPRGGVS